MQCTYTKKLLSNVIPLVTNQKIIDQETKKFHKTVYHWRKKNYGNEDLSKACSYACQSRPYLH